MAKSETDAEIEVLYRAMDKPVREERERIDVILNDFAITVMANRPSVGSFADQIRADALNRILCVRAPGPAEPTQIGWLFDGPDNSLVGLYRERAPESAPPHDPEEWPHHDDWLNMFDAGYQMARDELFDEVSPGEHLRVYNAAFDKALRHILASREESRSPAESDPERGDRNASIGYAERIFDLLDHWTPEQRARVFYEIETRWCWNCGYPQEDESAHLSCGKYPVAGESA